MTEYLLKPRLPVRAFLVSALLAVAGAVVLVAALDQSWHRAVAVVGGVLLLTGLVLLVLALVSLRTLALKVRVDDAGYRIVGPDLDVEGRWDEVTKVVQVDDGARLVFHLGEVRRTHLWCPGGAEDPQMQALTRDVARRLDANRGYRHTP